MISGMPQLVFIHVVISLPGAWSGITVWFGFFGNKRLDAGTHFLLMPPPSPASPDFFFLRSSCRLPTSSAFSRWSFSPSPALLATAKKKCRGWHKTYAVAAMISLPSTSSC
ncbi:MAG TPA: hypothetical protein VFR42_04210 [Candidatus Acidoferrum sp.]|nr:hypothetical protein [Candidatus Acidoferrum sp.]